MQQFIHTEKYWGIFLVKGLTAVRSVFTEAYPIFIQFVTQLEAEVLLDF